MVKSEQYHDISIFASARPKDLFLHMSEDPA